MGRVYDFKPKKTKAGKNKSIVLILLAVYLAYTLTSQYMVIRKSAHKKQPLGLK